MNTLNNFDTFYFLDFSPAHDALKMRGSLGAECPRVSCRMGGELMGWCRDTGSWSSVSAPDGSSEAAPTLATPTQHKHG